MPDQIPDGFVVVRFSPWSADGMRRKVLKDHAVDEYDGRRPGRFVLSVFATKQRSGESVDDAANRLCRELREDAGAPNGDRIAVVESRILKDGGFLVALDEPPRNHYVVGAPPHHLEMPDLGRLEQLFSVRRKNEYFGR